MIYFIVFINSISLYYCYFQTNRNKLFLIFSIVLPATIAGCRDIGVGTDTLVYSEHYFNIAKNIKLSEIFTYDNIDKGYLFLNYIAVQLHDSINSVFFFTELLILICVYATLSIIKVEKRHALLFMTLFYFCFYNISLNLMRQTCAISLSFLSYAFYVRKKWLISIFLILLSYTFHSSVIVALLIPYIDFLTKMRNGCIKKTFIFINIFIFIAIFIGFYKYVGLMSSLQIINANYADRYSTNGIFTSMNLSTIPKVDILIMLYILYILVKIKYQNKVNSNRIDFAIFIHFIYILFFALSFYSFFLYRISYYLLIIDLFEVCYFLSRKIIKNDLVTTFLVILNISIWYYNYIICFSGETYPYTSKILNNFII